LPQADLSARGRCVLDRLRDEAGSKRAVTATRVRECVQVTPVAARTVDARLFGEIVTATLERRRLRMTYHGRARDASSEREVSPLRLRYYRDNWYLDGWCHAAEGLRRFSVDRVTAVEVLGREAVAPEDVAEEAVADGYGIFTGKARYKAVLRFTPERARWVADEQWHPEQSGQMRVDGSYELTVPYSDPRELVGEILRHGAGVEVVRPKGLRLSIAKALDAAAVLYGTVSASETRRV
jgi:proteasome accessory factor C